MSSRNFLSLLISGAFLIAGQAFAMADDAQQPLHLCHKWTKNEWSLFRDLAAQSLAEEKDGFQDILTVFQECGIEMYVQGFDECMKDLRKYVFAQVPKVRERSNSSYFFLQTYDEYLSAQPKELMKLPVELADLAPAAWGAVAAKMGWEYVDFVSQTDRKRRIVILNRGEKSDRWILAVPESRIVDIIALENREKIHFREFEDQGKAPKGVDRYSIKGGGTPAGACFVCHLSGIRKIIPEPGTVRDSLGKSGLLSLTKINSFISAYDLPDWHGSIDQKSHGPPMGKSVGCTSCHEGTIRGILNRSTNRATIELKVMKDKSMPPGMAGQLSDADRKALVDRMFDEYPSELKKFFLKEACEPTHPASCPMNGGVGLSR
jgi:hypothetical protein